MNSQQDVSTKEQIEIRISLDCDGCVASKTLYKEHKSLIDSKTATNENLKKLLARHLGNFFKYVKNHIEQVRQEHAEVAEIVLQVGSTRQNMQIDQENAKCFNRSILFFPLLPLIAELICEQTERVCRVDGILLVDVMAKPDQIGQHFAEACEQEAKYFQGDIHLDDLQLVDSDLLLPDDDKILMQYLQTHHAAYSHQSSHRTIHHLFFDDSKGILDKNNAFYGSCPQLLPKQVKFYLIQLEQCGTPKQIAVIEGLGERDQHYLRNVVAMYKLYLLNVGFVENFEGVAAFSKEPNNLYWYHGYFADVQQLFLLFREQNNQQINVDDQLDVAIARLLYSKDPERFACLKQSVVKQINLYLSLDHDGCLANSNFNKAYKACVKENRGQVLDVNAIKAKLKKLVHEHNQILVQAIQAEIESQLKASRKVTQIYLFVGSNRQSVYVDLFNSSQHQGPSAYLLMSLMREVLEEELKIPCILDQTLIADVFSENASGTNFKQGLDLCDSNIFEYPKRYNEFQVQFAQYHTKFDNQDDEKQVIKRVFPGDTCLTDESKISLCYYQVHSTQQFSADSENSAGVFLFIDDSYSKANQPGVLYKLQKFYQQYPRYLPQQIEFKLLEYNGTGAVQERLSLRGQGTYDPYYVAHTQAFVCLFQGNAVTSIDEVLGYDLQENNSNDCWDYLNQELYWLGNVMAIDVFQDMLDKKLPNIYQAIAYCYYKKASSATIPFQVENDQEAIAYCYHKYGKPKRMIDYFQSLKDLNDLSPLLVACLFDYIESKEEWDEVSLNLIDYYSALKPIKELSEENLVKLAGYYASKEKLEKSLTYLNEKALRVFTIQENKRKEKEKEKEKEPTPRRDAPEISQRRPVRLSAASANSADLSNMFSVVGSIFRGEKPPRSNRTQPDPGVAKGHGKGK